MTTTLRATVLAGALSLALAPTAAWAHHSFSMFNLQQELTLNGTIKEFQWTNPHTFTWIEVTGADGKVETYGLEGMSPNYLGRRGWTKRTLKPGDKVTITINPLKDGLKGGMFLRCKLADGKEMVMFGNPPK
jgi:hypothetical protein